MGFCGASEIGPLIPNIATQHQGRCECTVAQRLEHAKPALAI
jgi:hypothetical protein